MLNFLRFIVLPLALIGVIVMWLLPHHSSEEEGYYRSVFCAIDHSQPQTFLQDMENIVEGSNSDYALRKTHFIPALGERMLNTWQQLSASEQAVIREDQQLCRELMSKKQQ